MLQRTSWASVLAEERGSSSAGPVRADMEGTLPSLVVVVHSQELYWVSGPSIPNLEERHFHMGPGDMAAAAVVEEEEEEEEGVEETSAWSWSSWICRRAAWLMADGWRSSVILAVLHLGWQWQCQRRHTYISIIIEHRRQQ